MQAAELSSSEDPHTVPVPNVNFLNHDISAEDLLRTDWDLLESLSLDYENTKRILDFRECMQIAEKRLHAVAKQSRNSISDRDECVSAINGLLEDLCAVESTSWHDECDRTATEVELAEMLRSLDEDSEDVRSHFLSV